MANVALHREKILQAAIRLYREKGYANSGLSEILALSGAPKGSLYYYFPGGKEELTAEAVRTAGKVVENTLRDLAIKSETPIAFIASYCSMLADWMAGSRFKSGCPIATTVLETVPFSKLLTETCASVFDSWITIVAEVFISAGSSEAVAKEKAEHVIIAVEGALLLTRVQQSVKPLLSVPKLLQP